MSAEVREIIQSLVDAETKGWDEKDIEPFLAMIHPDMAWPFAPNADAHDPIDWVFVLGASMKRDGGRATTNFFAAHHLIHNHRKTAKIEVAPTDPSVCCFRRMACTRSGSGIGRQKSSLFPVVYDRLKTQDQSESQLGARLADHRQLHVENCR
ncbi:hypothetical protein [Mesorhizobium sp.]|uniref:hypothetical protein n=1 Tax=Mesorhizobium sp. TaxID=1871066 RepID=UPI000FD18ADB|nr:hypothetical protein [Mesorhizobium sp.]RVC63788.1 hypothetical protein EN779_03900 [Mesorhizobium sp. M4B.F.Ca.ET.088.02.2.1]RWF25107.1 MAG: hypothetical protein EOS45_30975 [Mesorhizobium sp.]TIX44041.1 MAG: hypothetical protein E5V40_00810 [Mesorhizobium sp.]